MNAPLLKSTFVLLFTAVSATVPPAAFAGSTQATDQVAASFDRLLNPVPTKAAPAPQVAPTAAADPLTASVNAVLWQKPSYHLPAQYAFLQQKQKAKQ